MIIVKSETSHLFSSPSSVPQLRGDSSDHAGLVLTEEKEVPVISVSSQESAVAVSGQSEASLADTVVERGGLGRNTKLKNISIIGGGGKAGCDYMITVGRLVLTRMSVLSQWLLLSVVDVERVRPGQGVQHSGGDIEHHLNI